MEMKEKRNSEISVGDTEDLFKRIGTEGLSGRRSERNRLHTGRMSGEDFVQISWRFLV